MKADAGTSPDDAPREFARLAQTLTELGVLALMIALTPALTLLAVEPLSLMTALVLTCVFSGVARFALPVPDAMGVTLALWCAWLWLSFGYHALGATIDGHGPVETAAIVGLDLAHLGLAWWATRAAHQPPDTGDAAAVRTFGALVMSLLLAAAPLRASNAFAGGAAAAAGRVVALAALHTTLVVQAKTEAWPESRAMTRDSAIYLYLQMQYAMHVAPAWLAVALALTRAAFVAAWVTRHHQARVSGTVRSAARTVSETASAVRGRRGEPSRSGRSGRRRDESDEEALRMSKRPAQPV